MIGSIVVAVLLFLLFGTSVFSWGRIKEPFVTFFYNRVKWHTSIDRNEYLRISKMLKRYVPYFTALSANGKAKFINRLKHIQEEKAFVGREGLQVTEEMKLLISAAIAQITFGLDDYLLLKYDRFFLYPDIYHSTIMGADLKGGTSTTNTISFSWRHLKEGFDVPDDKVNLALHEVAHAMKLSVLKGQDFDKRFAAYLDQWFEVGRKEFARMKQNKRSFLRRYARRNKHEFFAVCMEHFFEAPEAFQAELPDVFNHFCVLLRQNPLNKLGDYEFTESFVEEVNQQKELLPIPFIVRKTIKYDSWHWSLSIWFFGFLGGGIVFLGNWDNFGASNSELFTFLSLVAISGGLAQIRSLVLSGFMNWIAYIFYILLGFTPFFASIFLLLNMFTPMTQEVEKYQITHVVAGVNQYVLTLEEGAYEHWALVRTVSSYKYDQQRLSQEGIGPPSHIQLTLAKGIMGWKTFEKSELIFSEKDELTALPAR